MPKKQPSMADKKKKKKPLKQKQKQKQIVKTNVKVNVQASGGSGGGGSGGSAPAPSYVPQMFRDTSGENPRLISLVEQIVARVPRLSVAAPSAPEYNPANDVASVNAVFNAPINTDVPVEVGGVKKSGRPKGSKNRPRPIAFVVGSEADNDPETFNAVFNAPMNTNVPRELKAAGQSDEEMMRRKLIREERRSRKAFEEVNPEMMGFASSNVPGIPSQFFNTNM